MLPKNGTELDVANMPAVVLPEYSEKVINRTDIHRFNEALQIGQFLSSIEPNFEKTDYLSVVHPRQICLADVGRTKAAQTQSGRLKGFRQDHRAFYGVVNHTTLNERP